MKTSNYCPQSISLKTGTSLTVLVDQLLQNAAPQAQASKTVLVNEIEPAFFTAVSEAVIRPVLEEIIYSLLLAAYKGRIHVLAEKFGDSINIEFQEQNNYNGYALAFRLCSVEPLAREAGGYLSVKGEKSLLARVSFCFQDK